MKLDTSKRCVDDSIAHLQAVMIHFVIMGCEWQEPPPDHGERYGRKPSAEQRTAGAKLECLANEVQDLLGEIDERVEEIYSLTNPKPRR